MMSRPPAQSRSRAAVGPLRVLFTGSIALLIATLGACSTNSPLIDAALAPDLDRDLLEAAPTRLDAGPDLGTETPQTWATIKPGKFTMGSPTTEMCHIYEEVQHEVTLTRTFRMTTTEISQARFYRLMRYNRSGFEGCGDCPVENVSWHEAANYANKLSLNDGLAPCYSCSGKDHLVRCDEAAAYTGQQIYDCPGYRLPTEAEWEYAYRAGTTTPFYSGVNIGCGDTRDAAAFPDATKDPTIDQSAWAIAWYTNSSDGRTHPGGKRTANAWGLYDMAGNVWEWCNDRRAAYPSTPVTDPAGPTVGNKRIVRGADITSMIMYLRAAFRHLHTPAYFDQHTGFRLVQTTTKP